MHSLCVALLFFVSACSAQDIKETVTCCAPPVLQGDAYSSGIVFTGGRKYYFTASTRFYYSDPKDKVATTTIVNIQGLGNVTVKVLNDYNTGRGYRVTNGQCKTTRISTTFQKNCVPSGADYLGTLKVGSASNYLRTNSYSYTVRSSSAAVDVESLKYPYGSGCYDVALSTVTKSRFGALMSSVAMVMGNHKTTIPFSSVFNVPYECYTSSEEENLVEGMSFDFINYII